MEKSDCICTALFTNPECPKHGTLFQRSVERQIKWYPFPRPEDGDFYTVQDWFEFTKPGWIFTDDDGSGYYATDKGYSRDFPAIPSERLRNKPFWATHVCWFNK